MHATMIRRVRTAAVSRSTTLCTQRIPGRTSQTISMATLSQSRPASSLPRVAQTSFWKSLVPKPFRRGADGTVPAADAMAKARKSKEWNPATFYIFIFLFIGSMSIQMISQKKDFDTFMRQSEVKIGLLREVVERIQKGEDVDVERILGTGDPAKEAEWEDVLKEIERDDGSRNAKRQDKTTPPAAAQPPAAPAPSQKIAGASSPQNAVGSKPSTKVAAATSFY